MFIIDWIADALGTHPLHVIFWGMFGAVLLLTALWAGMAFRYTRQRRRKLSEFAEQHGWDFRHPFCKHASAEIPQPYRKSPGISPRAQNRITGDLEGFAIAAYDDSFSVLNGKSLRRITQTVVAIHIDPSLPEISVEPKGWFGGLKSKRHVDLVDWPELTQTFVVTSPDPSEAPAVFSSQLVDLLLEQPKHKFQVRGGWLLLFAEEHRAEPDEIGRTIDRLLQLAEAFAPACAQEAA